MYTKAATCLRPAVAGVLGTAVTLLAELAAAQAARPELREGLLSGSSCKMQYCTAQTMQLYHVWQLVLMVCMATRIFAQSNWQCTAQHVVRTVLYGVNRSTEDQNM